MKSNLLKKNILLRKLFSFFILFPLFFAFQTYSSPSYSLPKPIPEEIMIQGENFYLSVFVNEKGGFEKKQETKSVTRSLSGTLEKIATSSSLNPEYILHFQYSERNNAKKSTQNIKTTLRLKKNEKVLFSTITNSEFYLIQGVKKEQIKKNRLHVQIN